MAVDTDRPRIKPVLGPDGTPISVADLPKHTRRWVIGRKALVVAAVRGGLLAIEDVCSKYVLAVDEYIGWERSIDMHGLAGLRTTRIQQYRASEQKHLNPLVRALQEARDACIKTEELLSAMETSEQRLRAALASLQTEIASLRTYAERPHMANSVGIMIDSLQVREKNLDRSLVTLATRSETARVELEVEGARLAQALSAYERGAERASLPRSE